MVGPASPLALQPLARPLPVPVTLATPAGLRAPAACESCHRAPAAFTLTWPDLRFLVCAHCLPPATPAGTVLGVVALPVARQRPRSATASPSWSPVASAPGRSSSIGATPSRTLIAPPRQAGTASQPAAPAAVQQPELEVLHAAARTVLTSPPSPRGRRISNAGGCDVVAALVLAAGGTVDESGRPAEPTERTAARLLRRALRRVADQLAGYPWTGDPVVLVDAWQAHPGLSRLARVAVLEAAAGPAPHTGGPSTPAPAAAADTGGGGDSGGDRVSCGRPAPTSPATPEHPMTGARS